MIAYVTVRTQVHALSIDVSDRHLRSGGNRGQASTPRWPRDSSSIAIWQASVASGRPRLQSSPGPPRPCLAVLLLNLWALPAWQIQEHLLQQVLGALRDDDVEIVQLDADEGQTDCIVLQRVNKHQGLLWELAILVVSYSIMSLLMHAWRKAVGDLFTVLYCTHAGVCLP